jgi:hypothetical protein
MNTTTTKAMTANSMRRLDIKVQIAQLKEELALLDDQWRDHERDLRDEGEGPWFDYIYCQDEIAKAYQEWELVNPDWKVVAASPRRRKKPNL